MEKEFAKEDLGKGEALKIDKSKDAMSTSPWGNVDKTALRNKVLSASNYKAAVEACYAWRWWSRGLLQWCIWGWRRQLCDSCSRESYGMGKWGHGWRPVRRRRRWRRHKQRRRSRRKPRRRCWWGKLWYSWYSRCLQFGRTWRNLSILYK